MKLVRYGAPGAEKPGILDAEGQLRDLSAHASDIDGGLLADLSALDGVDPAALPLVSGDPRIGACVANVGKFICIGLNFTDHAEETGNPIPEEPVVFMKASSAVSGPNDDIVMPRGSKKTDWEVELGVVIGKPAKYVSKAEALDHVAGYCVIHDVSERALQTEGSGQWTKGKSCDTFGPIGPYLVTKEDIEDVQNLGMRLDVNGVTRQNGSTKTMIFDVATLVSYLSTLFTLEPGDVISTGTPPGVGLGMTPPVFLKEGDRVTLSIDGLGEQSQAVVAEA